MRSKSIRTSLLAGAALIGASLPASASFISQGVTFTFQAVDADTLQLTIDNVLNASGNWAPVQFLDGFDIRNVGSFSAATATYSGGGSVNAVLSEQFNGSGTGCQNGGGFSACFNFPNISLTNHMVFTIDFTPSGGGLNFFGTPAPHLKLAFLTNQNDTSKTGDLLSQDITVDRAVPGPVVGAGLPGLVAAFGGLLAWKRRRRTVA